MLNESTPIFGFVHFISDIVDEDNECLIIMLNKILEIVFASVVSTGTPAYLEYLVKCFDEQLRYLVGDEKNKYAQ